MKIGIMLRHLGQHGGGVLVYTESLLRRLLAMDTGHEFVLLHSDDTRVGAYGRGAQVRELVLGRAPTLMWDQWAAWQAARREHLDIIFNPKYSLPLMSNCRGVFVCHGLDWYIMPWGSRPLDRINHRLLIPRYTKKAAAIIAVSETARQNMIEYLHAEESRVHTVYHGVDEAFSLPVAPERLEEVRRRYGLPERFLLYCGQIYPPKNFGRLIQAYARVGPPQGISLVVAGSHTWLCEDEIALIDKLGLGDWVVRPGWIGRGDLPAFYRLAEALVLPSLYESFGTPIVEAMSSGCPVVTSDCYGAAEIAGGAALLVDPDHVDSIAEGIEQVIDDQQLRRRLIEAGHKRAGDFSWEKCARETLEVLEQAEVQMPQQ
ncbi:MAG: glycosyltransferase family 1 protein [Arenicellales bacterium]|jgi:glycosyltransferase involved in cell wall biosynthesis